MTSWIEGTEHGLVWYHGVAVVSGEVPLAEACRLWDAVGSETDLAEFLRLLSEHAGTDLLRLPDFAVALAVGDGWQVAVRGRLEALVDDEPVRGAGISTWTERSIPVGASFVLGAADAPQGPLRPVMAGVLPAGRLEWADTAEEAVPRRKASRAWLPATAREPEPVAAPPPARVEPVAESAPVPVESVAEPAPVPVEPVAEPEPVAEQLTWAEPAEDEIPAESESPAEPEPAAEPESRAEPVALPIDDGIEVVEDPWPPAPDAQPPVYGPAVPGRFARQFEQTRDWSVQDAAVRVPDDEPAGVDSPPEPDLLVADPARELRDEPGDELGDHDGSTAMMGKLNVPPPDPEADPDAPLVLGVACAGGHANPPHRTACGVCGEPIVGEPVRVPRPSLGRLRLPSGEEIELKTPIILGRNPRADQVHGTVLPRLVPLSQGHVSGSHLELRLEEWNVFAVDLQSTNGTFLRREGQALVRLGERPELLIQGDVLDLGHGVQLRMESLR